MQIDKEDFCDEIEQTIEAGELRLITPITVHHGLLSIKIWTSPMPECDVDPLMYLPYGGYACQTNKYSRGAIEIKKGLWLEIDKSLQEEDRYQTAYRIQEYLAKEWDVFWVHVDLQLAGVEVQTAQRDTHSRYTEGMYPDQRDDTMVLVEWVMDEFAAKILSSVENECSGPMRTAIEQAVSEGAFDPIKHSAIYRAAANKWGTAIPKEILTAIL
jgi:hypothetical protein